MVNSRLPNRKRPRSSASASKGCTPAPGLGPPGDEWRNALCFRLCGTFDTGSGQTLQFLSENGTFLESFLTGIGKKAGLYVALAITNAPEQDNWLFLLLFCFSFGWCEPACSATIALERLEIVVHIQLHSSSHVRSLHYLTAHVLVPAKEDIQRAATLSEQGRHL